MSRDILSRFKWVILNLTDMRQRSFDDEFKRMAVELSKLKSSVKEAGEEFEY